MSTGSLPFRPAGFGLTPLESVDMNPYPPFLFLFFLLVYGSSGLTLCRVMAISFHRSSGLYGWGSMLLRACISSGLQGDGIITLRA